MERNLQTTEDKPISCCHKDNVEKVFATTSNLDEIMQILDRLPHINEAGRRTLELMVNLTVEDGTKIMRYIERYNPGLSDVIKRLGCWFPKTEKHHVRLLLLCLVMVLMASQIQLPRKLKHLS